MFRSAGQRSRFSSDFEGYCIFSEQQQNKKTGSVSEHQSEICDSSSLRVFAASKVCTPSFYNLVPFFTRTSDRGASSSKKKKREANPSFGTTRHGRCRRRQRRPPETRSPGGWARPLRACGGARPRRSPPAWPGRRWRAPRASSPGIPAQCCTCSSPCGPHDQKTVRFLARRRRRRDERFRLSVEEIYRG